MEYGETDSQAARQQTGEVDEVKPPSRAKTQKSASPMSRDRHKQPPVARLVHQHHPTLACPRSAARSP